MGRITFSIQSQNPSGLAIIRSCRKGCRRRRQGICIHSNFLLKSPLDCPIKINIRSGLINGLAPTGQNGLPSLSSPHVMAGRRPVEAWKKAEFQACFPQIPLISPSKEGLLLFWGLSHKDPLKKERKRSPSLSPQSPIQ